MVRRRLSGTRYDADGELPRAIHVNQQRSRVISLCESGTNSACAWCLVPKKQKVSSTIYSTTRETLLVSCLEMSWNFVHSVRHGNCSITLEMEKFTKVKVLDLTSGIKSYGETQTTDDGYS
ncbi:unnamed protein product [Fusarium graminearum]|nr:unnamed protein product [Fusarium graminearum]